MDNYDIKCRLIEEELKTFWPQWHVIRRLGGGTFGDVFEIYRDHFGIQESSALKIIQISDAAETYALFLSPVEVEKSRTQDGQSEIPEAFRNEIQIMEALRGAPNIVTIEDFYLKRDASSTMLFARMELLTSFQQMMTDRHRKQSPFTIPDVLKIGRDICTALMYCETKGIIHRDIKPANLFMDGFGNYKVGDFGVSRRMDTVHVALTMTGIGTISYMAPEVYRGSAYNNTVDIYALGLILYQLLNYGRMPFVPKTGAYTAKDIDSANYRRLHGEPLPSLTGIRIKNVTVDASLDAMIRKACAIRSEDRYQSAKAFYEDLAVWGTQKKEPGKDIPQRQLQQIHERKWLSQAKLGPQNVSQPRKNEQSPATNDSSARDVQKTGKDFSRNNDQNARREISSREDDTDSRQSHSHGLESDEKVNRSVRIKKKPDIPIPAILTVIAVLLLCIGYILMRGAQHTSPSSLASGTLEEPTDPNAKTGDPILDSWEEIITAGEDGSYAEKYHIGDTKELDLGEEGVIRMELVALDADELADGNGKAHMTWIAKDLLNTEHCMNEEGTNDGFWLRSDLRKWLNESIFPLIPDNIRLNIKEVKNKCLVGSTGFMISEDFIWIPNDSEVTLPVWDGDTLLRDNESLKRCHVGKTSASWWWQRSSCSSTAYFVVTSGGDVTNDYVGNSLGVVIGFCL